MLQNYKKLSDLPRKFQSYQNSIKSVLFVIMLKKKVGSEVSFKKCSPTHAESNNTAMHLSTSCPSVTPDNYKLLLHKAVTPRWSCFRTPAVDIQPPVPTPKPVAVPSSLPLQKVRLSTPREHAAVTLPCHRPSPGRTGHSEVTSQPAAKARPPPAPVPAAGWLSPGSLP